tara:strand:+ start:2346 stop:3125 length:780 start_codon:yes stop_codon:yes gene_type:complete
MKKGYASILITNYNKSFYIKKTIKSCLNQNFQKKEILVFDDCSSDNSLEILETFKNDVILIKNKKKNFQSGPLNQIHGLIKLFKKSKGEIIFFLDGDDHYKKNKISSIFKIFNKNQNIDFLQDIPYLENKKIFKTLKIKKHNISIWPQFYPTSCISIRRKFMLDFLNYIKKGNFENLEIDARLSMFAFLKKKFIVLNKSFTIYNYDKSGITSGYRKYSIPWWKKRNEAFSYLFILHKKLRLKFFYSLDFYFTRFINFFI